jgi:hypothetical protein
MQYCRMLSVSFVLIGAFNLSCCITTSNWVQFVAKCEQLKMAKLDWQGGLEWREKQGRKFATAGTHHGEQGTESKVRLTSMAMREEIRRIKDLQRSCGDYTVKWLADESPYLAYIMSPKSQELLLSDWEEIAQRSDGIEGKLIVDTLDDGLKPFDYSRTSIVRWSRGTLRSNSQK